MALLLAGLLEIGPSIFDVVAGVSVIAFGLAMASDIVLSCCWGASAIWGWSAVKVEIPLSLSVSSVLAVGVEWDAGVVAVVSGTGVPESAGWMTPRLSRGAGAVNVVVRPVVLVVVDPVVLVLPSLSRPGVSTGDVAEGCLVVAVGVFSAGARSSSCDSEGASSAPGGTNTHFWSPSGLTFRCRCDTRAASSGWSSSMCLSSSSTNRSSSSPSS